MGLRKAIFPENELPPLTVFPNGEFGYRVRYRVVSEDGDRSSHLSPIFSVLANYIFKRPRGRSLSDIGVTRTGPYVTVVWDPVSVADRPTENIIKKASSYDLWLRWSRNEANALWIPAERVEGNTQGFFVPTEYFLENGTLIEEEPTFLSVEIYIRATRQSRENSALLVYQANNVDISVPLPPPAN
jgi:hypothetical protein